MNILITGMSGFIGKNLFSIIRDSNFLKENDHIINLGSKPIEGSIFIDHKNYTFSKKDFLDLGINNIDIVLHIGAFTPKSSIETNDINQSISNIINTKHLIDNLPSKPTKFIYASTIDVYSNDGGLITEQSTLVPNSLYGQSKLFCERFLEYWSSTNDVVLQILRLGHIYGIGEEEYQKIIPNAIRAILADTSVIIGTKGEEKRSFLHVKDCCMLILKSLELNSYKGPINLVSGKSVSISELISILFMISGKQVNSIYTNEKLDPVDYVFDNKKMIKYLGSDQIPLCNGLKEEYDHVKGD